MSSKFKGIFDAARGNQPDEAEQQPSERPSERPVEQAAPRRTARPAHREAPPEVVPAPEVSEPKRRGRPAGGKRNDPDFEQVTAYVRKDIHRRVKIALLQQGQKQEFSELVDDLLTQWLGTQR
jgi:hypothetical protein